MSFSKVAYNVPGVSEVAMKVTERAGRYKYKANLVCGGWVVIAPTLCLSRPCGVRECACLRQVNRKQNCLLKTNTPELGAVDLPFDFCYQKPRLGWSIVGQSFRADPDTIDPGKLQLTKQVSAATTGHTASNSKEGQRKQTIKAVYLSAGRLPCPTAGHQLCRDSQAISAYSLTVCRFAMGGIFTANVYV